MKRPIKISNPLSDIIYEWISLKINQKFNEEVDIRQEILITNNDKLLIVLTPETSIIDISIQQYLQYLVNSLNADSLSIEEMKCDIENNRNH